MTLISLNGTRFTSKDDMYDYLGEQISLPNYFGRNLDALADILSSTSKTTIIEIINSEAITDNLGDYGNKFLSLIETLEERHKHIILKSY